ncbi:MAG: RNA polymerase sigma factor (sigma-70 family) [Ulvibacter sp.]|jgi:RNA polymerase sigma factor (sigma-70 family)
MRNSDKIFDSWLVLQCQSGNKKAIALLVKRWHKKLCKQANWYIKDVVQDSWRGIFNNIRKVRDSNQFGSWVLSIITIKSTDWIRKSKRDVKKREASKDDRPDNRLINLRMAINKLTQQHQTVLHLFYLEEYTIKEIGEIMHLPVGTIKSRLFNAREKLKLIIKIKSHEK